MSEQRRIPIIEQRRIEANVLASVYEELKARRGEAEARSVIGEAVTRAAIQQGESFAGELDRPADFTDFSAILPNWTAGGALEMTVLEAGPETLSFNVTRCRYAEMYRAMGLGDIGDLLSCNRDGAFCEGFNPKMKLRRTQTIMSGASHCDFRYSMEDEAAQ
ncbi:L-2-amino-thiazoline-4-carboxylic acid hydrolase [Martelella mediterranea]|uniref:L-2-amino-thiazoline-4-carboxylic acid hydrolase n=1 Tax=Martelella mediterranea TaxID=293089 RepID=UPI001E337926|nr:L-2-amino-thiazoline-4-carboxylic acid hydrolase [Martelella mediterranea]MCD1636919.1 L-2-amino-thiazoline-4-carboxylic acid hydrolase [Martelella mediterranea]